MKEIGVGVIGYRYCTFLLVMVMCTHEYFL
jgi:hypothetical protein